MSLGLTSWQTLARKMAHEVKNSLTPIRLTVEEMLARRGERDDRLHGAGRADRRGRNRDAGTARPRVLAIRRRAAGQLAAPLDVNALVRSASLPANSASRGGLRVRGLSSNAPASSPTTDLLKGILTNLLENAAEAAGEGGRILGVTTAEDGRVAIEVHDSGPGLSEQARSSLFQPTISFKKRGMGLGLSIARKSALLSGGDIVLVKGELGGAGFRVLLPSADEWHRSAF